MIGPGPVVTGPECQEVSVSGCRIYLSLIPQGLIASMLEPDDFGSYYALGNKVHSRGEAIFFEVDPAQIPEQEFPLHLADERCVAKPDGSPRKSIYLAIYRVLSRIPISALRKLYLVTQDGMTLALERGELPAETENGAHLYQEFCPTDPIVASRLSPQAFCRAITDPDDPVHVPRIVFSELYLGELARDPMHGSAQDLPYPNLENLRDILVDLQRAQGKQNKLFLRQASDGVHYRTIHGGFYVGDQEQVAYYPMPDAEALATSHYAWWRSAQRG
jgi:hypothetical protein